MKDSQDVHTTMEQFDLTQSQLLLWMGQQLSPDSPLYNMALTFEFRFAVDIPSFQQAFERLIEGCDSMRTVFTTVNEKPQQSILSTLDIDLEFIDFSQLSNKKTTLEEWIEKRTKNLFDISTCLFDGVLIKMDEAHFIWYFNQHHLITDAWGVAVQFQMLSKIYKSIITNTEEELLTIEQPKFEDYIRLELAERTMDSENQASSYWHNKAKVLSSPPIFFGQLNQEGKSKSERVTLKLSKEKSDQLRALTIEKDLRAWTQHLSLFNIFSTLLFAMIYRLTGQEKLTIGTPAHNRLTEKFKKTSGMFIKIFPLMASLSDDDTFGSVFQKIRNETNEFLRYAQTGMSTSELNKSYNVVLNYINATVGTFNDQEVQSDWVHSGYADPNHHLRMQVYDFDAAGAMVLSFDMNCAVFDSSTRSFIPSKFVELIDLFLADRFQPIVTLTSAEQKMLADFNETSVDYPKNKTIIDYFEEQVKRHPEGTAIIFQDQSWTYSTLNKKVNQLANYLLSKGVKGEDPISICIDRSLEMMLGLVSILKAGAAYVPIDPTFPIDRINFIFQDAQTKFLITTKQYAHLFQAEKDIEIILIDEDWPEISKFSTEVPFTDLVPEHLMYIMYTSGSTGRPKGVMNQHDGVLNRLLWGHHHFQLDPATDVILQKTTFCFDLSVWELFWPLISGIKLVFAEPEGHKDSDYLRKVIDEYQITTIRFVASMLEVFLMAIPVGSCKSLRLVVSGGEALLVPQVIAFLEKLPHASLNNLYGPTEAAMEVSEWMASSIFEKTDTVLIGKPIANTKLYVLNSEGQQTPIGLPGELHIAGIQVARGYHNRPEISAEKFIKNPLDDHAYSRMYKTGDLARWLPNGNIEYLGRIDNQVKIRGYRIELDEIAMVIQEIEKIRQCVVVVHVDSTQNKRLIAYVVAEEELDEAFLSSYLKTKLPYYMIPSIYVPLAAIPYNLNGKIDRSALPIPDLNRSKVEDKYLAPQSEFEELIHEIWSEVLQIDKIGIHDNFIELGGDSLTAIRIVVRINLEMELDLPVNSVFRKSTIAQLATYVENTIKNLLAELEKSNS